jgi:ABC-type lipoprotein export system ATPase subunit
MDGSQRAGPCVSEGRHVAHQVELPGRTLIVVTHDADVRAMADDITFSERRPSFLRN